MQLVVVSEETLFEVPLKVSPLPSENNYYMS